MSDPSKNIRVEQIQKVYLNGQPAKRFVAFVRRGEDFVYEGTFNAPIKTPNRDLWKHVG